MIFLFVYLAIWLNFGKIICFIRGAIICFIRGALLEEHFGKIICIIRGAGLVLVYLWNLIIIRILMGCSFI